MLNNQKETKHLKKSEIKEALFLTYNECAESKSFNRFNEIFSGKLTVILEKRLTTEELKAMSVQPSITANVAKIQLGQLLLGQFGGEAITREQFDKLNEKPTHVEKVKNLGNNILDITVNKLFNSPLNKIFDTKYVEQNTTARNKNTFKKRVKELKQVANTNEYGGLGL